ncbi:MAG: apolipoprotein N-acyltransferase [Candidatus Omnitrophota bacterium]|nr:apolipoprotein N-acyltransferase [Candidatus Omnitrophota bacterium]
MVYGLLSKRGSLILSIISGVLLSLPFFEGRLWFFAWFAFLPLFFSFQKKSKLQAFLLSYLTGLIFWTLTIYWLVHVTLLGQILLILYLSLYFGFFGLCFSTINYQLSTINYLFLPSLWVVLEYLRAHLLTGFGWALLGYSQYLNLPIIQIADLFGAYGVSFLVVMANIVIYSAFSLKLSASSKIRKCSVFVLSFSIILVYGYYQLSRKPKVAWAIGGPTTAFWPAESRKLFKISLIQGNIPQELKWASGSQAFILDRYIRLTKEAALAKPDLIIWPEASNPGFLGDESDARVNENIFNLAKEIKIPLLVGSVVKEKRKYFNSALLINEFGISGRYDKLHLVPFGEYIPLKGAFKFLESIVPIGDFTAGNNYTLFLLSAIRYPLSAKFGALICFEDTLPELSRNFAREGADFLVNITNDAWFKETTAPYQHLSASVFRAVENRLPLARSANTGISCFIDSRGRVISRLIQNGKDIFVSGIKTQDIILSPKSKSLYQSIGDVFVLGCFALMCFYGIMSKIKKG